MMLRMLMRISMYIYKPGDYLGGDGCDHDCGCDDEDEDEQEDAVDQAGEDQARYGDDGRYDCDCDEQNEEHV